MANNYTEKKKISNKKHDDAHFKYQSVKLKIEEYEQLKRAVEVSGESMNGFIRAAIMHRVNNLNNFKSTGNADRLPHSDDETSNITREALDVLAAICGDN